MYDTTAAQYYMDVRNAKRSVEYLHDDLALILKDSNGVFVYQEEVMKFLVDIVGYTWEESDRIRDAIAKKKHEVIMATFDKIRVSCAARGWDHGAIETVCQQIQAFSRYSFNKSHSHAYGELGYITMYLKHHHKLEWWCSILNLSLDDSEEKTRKYIALLGDLVKPPSLKHPTSKFEIREVDGERVIITPISAIKGCGPAVVNELCTKGPFASIEDLIERIDHRKVNTGCISSLIKGRAADDMMDADVPVYSDRRLKFIEDFKRIRAKEVKLQPDVFNVDPLSIFMQEKEYNTAFNKALLSSLEIVDVLKSKWPALSTTGRAGAPLLMKVDGKQIPVLANLKVAEGFLKKGYSSEIGLILLYEESTAKKGISKRSGKQWSNLTVHLSDGFHQIECVDWKKSVALKWPKNTIVYVRGILEEGWKTPVSLNIKEIERIE